MAQDYSGKISDLKIGDSESITRTLTADHIDRFADAIDSHHPIHMNADWVKSETDFGTARVVHGLMTAALVSRTIVNFLDRHKLKGAICFTESKFIAPVHAGDTITITLTYRGQVPDKPRLSFSTEARNQDGNVMMAGSIQEHIFL
jgi:acyl dehydratase